VMTSGKCRSSAKTSLAAISQYLQGFPAEFAVQNIDPRRFVRG
jgi:hypothetical protein